MPRRLPPLNALMAFEAAALHESFTRAAEELCVTQGAVSHQVKALEVELGLKLFTARAEIVVGTSQHIPDSSSAVAEVVTRPADQGVAGSCSRRQRPLRPYTLADVHRMPGSAVKP